MLHRNSALIVLLLLIIGNYVRAVITTHVGPRYPYIAINYVFNYLRRMTGEQRIDQSATVMSTRTSRPYRINQTLFGDSRPAGATLKIAGSDVMSRNAQVDLLAQDYGLPSDFVSLIYTVPRVKSTIAEYSAFIDCSPCIHGLFAYVRVPFIYTNWDMKLREKILNPGVNGYEPGFVSEQAVARSDLLGSFTDYITGTAAPVIKSIKMQPLYYSRMSMRGLIAHGCPEIQGMVGYDIYSSYCGTLSCAVRGSLPLGNRPEARYLFEPIVGNERHVQLGGELTGCWHYPLNNIDERECFMFYGSCSVDHLFKNKQRRTFDLIGKPLSRYRMVLKKDVHERVCCPLANLTTRDVDVHVACQIQLTLLWAYEKASWHWAMGYNLYIQTPDIIKQRSSSFPGSLDTELWVFLTDPSTVLKTSDIDINSGSSKKSINTLFSQVYYRPDICENRSLTPVIGFGGAIEMGSCESASKSTSQSGIINSAFSNWNVWVSIGLVL